MDRKSAVASGLPRNVRIQPYEPWKVGGLEPFTQQFLKENSCSVGSASTLLGIRVIDTNMEFSTIGSLIGEQGYFCLAHLQISMFNHGDVGMLALKSVKQGYSPTTEILCLLESFRRMVNDCVEIGLSYNVTTLKRLSTLSWERRRVYKCPAYYKASAVSRAAGILAARKKSLRRGIPTKDTYSLRPQITAYMGFKIKDGSLWIPVGGRKFQTLPLTKR